MARRSPIASPVQARTAEQDRAGETRHACSKCQITYYTRQGQKVACPLCGANRKILEMRNAMARMREHIESLETRNQRLQIHLDLVSAMREGAAIIEVEDLVFLKSVLYRYRSDPKSIYLRVTHGPGKRGRPPPANGFVAVPQTGDPEAHVCTSIGGAAIAGYYQEAVRSVGVPGAMATIMRALNSTLSASE